MAPTTRQISRITPPPDNNHGLECNTIQKTRFFDVYDKYHEVKSIRAICQENSINDRTGRRWLQQRRDIGSAAYRRHRPRSDKLGRRSQVTKAMCKALIDPMKNPVRDRPLEAQLAYHNIPVGRRQVARKLKKYTKGGQIYKAAFVKKDISQQNHDERYNYGVEHKDKTINEFWRYILFTDEAHIDPSSLIALIILRERRKRYNTENIAQRPAKTGVRLHIAAWVTWDAKAEKLEFYNDEEDYTVHPPMPPKPRRRPRTESEDEYQARVQEWEALRPHSAEVKIRGNSMTQKYYTERLLPVYINAIESQRERVPGPWLLQEDGDPSHGKRKRGLAQELKERHSIKNLQHPAQSPDLNPIEAAWNILKQRLRRRIFESEEVKKVLEEEWAKITQEEIQDRIKDMPDRCSTLESTGGKPIKSGKW